MTDGAPSPAGHRRQLQGIEMRATGEVSETRDRSDAVVVTRTPLRGPARRDRYEPRSDGRWMHVEERWSGCRWVFVGSEILEDVDVEVAGGEVLG